MKQNNFNQLPKYETIFGRLKQTLNTYLKLFGEDNILKYYSMNKKKDKIGFNNSLIDSDFEAFELVNTIKNSYLSRDYLKGEIGLIDRTKSV